MCRLQLCDIKHDNLKSIQNLLEAFSFKWEEPLAFWKFRFHMTEHPAHDSNKNLFDVLETSPIMNYDTSDFHKPDIEF